MQSSLKSWVSIWNPVYRWLLIELLSLGTVYAVLVYLENTLLQDLIQILTQPEATDSSWIGQAIASAFGAAAAPFAAIGAVFVVGMIRIISSARRDIISSTLFIRSRADLEREVLHHLLHREDGFYSQHSMGEIMNRLEVDLLRVLDRRDSMVDLWWALLMIGSNLLFFAIGDWRLAIVVIAICVLGTYATNRASRPVAPADQRYFESHDRVKMDFEDYLKAVPEVQVDGLYGVILRRFTHPQKGRLSAFMDWARAYATVEFSKGTAAIVALLVTVLIVLFASQVKGSADARHIALIPVLIYALPRIFLSVTSLVTLRTNYQMAGNSVERLLEYDAGRLLSEPKEPRDRVADAEYEAASEVKLEDCTYQYPSPDGGLQGGISEVSAEFRSGKWSAIVGGAGSGKSTLVNLLLGRLQPQKGEVLGVDDTAATLMPQKIVLLDASIRANLLLGARMDPDHATPSDGDLQVVESVGLGAVCRLKALEMRPTPDALERGTVPIEDLRKQARDRAAALGIRLALFEDGHVDPRRPTVDGLLGGRTNGTSATHEILSGARPAWLSHLAQSVLGDTLVAHARFVVKQSRNLLELPNYQDFASLSPEPIDQRVWELRRSCLGTLDLESHSADDRAKLVRVALTSVPGEWGVDQASADTLFGSLRSKHAEAIDRLRSVLQGHWGPFAVDRVHPFLIWRDNLLFASPAITNQRQRRLLDNTLLELMQDAPWAQFFVAQGIEFEVGRNGSRLSGGQGQLLALARAALRRTPLLVLDEPTSALDPASRDRVGSFLRSWSERRVVITISHDPDLVRCADDIHVMSGGRHVGRGGYDELLETCEPFRTIFRRKG